MNQLTAFRKELESLLNEHNAILDKIEEIINWWAQLEEKGLPKYGEMGMHIHELRDMLATHYEEEEEKGYFEQIKENYPEIDFKDRDFVKEHSHLLMQLNIFAEKLSLPEPAFKNWNEAMEEFEAFLKQFNNHERAETRIINKVLQA